MVQQPGAAYWLLSLVIKKMTRPVATFTAMAVAAEADGGRPHAHAPSRALLPLLKRNAATAATTLAIDSVQLVVTASAVQIDKSSAAVCRQ